MRKVSFTAIHSARNVFKQPLIPDTTREQRIEEGGVVSWVQGLRPDVRELEHPFEKLLAIAGVQVRRAAKEAVEGR